MPKTVFITATNTDVGKTYTTLQLLHACGRAGLKPAVLKPIETGVDPVAMDGTVLLETAKQYNDALKEYEVEDIVPIRYTLPAAPYVASGGEDIDLSPVWERLEALKKISDVVFVEGAGGILVPIDSHQNMLDIAKKVDKTLLVSHDRLGCINDTLLNLSLFEREGLEYEWCMNVRERESFEKITLPYLQGRFEEVLSIQEDADALLSKLINSVH